MRLCGEDEGRIGTLQNCVIAELNSLNSSITKLHNFTVTQFCDYPITQFYNYSFPQCFNSHKNQPRAIGPTKNQAKHLIP